jgi:hypothetical protein
MQGGAGCSRRPRGGSGAIDRRQPRRPRCPRISHLRGWAGKSDRRADEAAYFASIARAPRKSPSGSRIPRRREIARGRSADPSTATVASAAAASGADAARNLALDFNRQRRQRRCFDRLGRLVRRSDGAGRRHPLGLWQSRSPSNHPGPRLYHVFNLAPGSSPSDAVMARLGAPTTIHGNIRGTEQ